jgi:hypothetical protein
MAFSSSSIDTAAVLVGVAVHDGYAPVEASLLQYAAYRLDRVFAIVEDARKFSSVIGWHRVKEPTDFAAGHTNRQFGFKFVLYAHAP